MTPRSEGEDGNLLNQLLPSDTDYKLLANLIFDEPDNEDGAKARAELQRICRAAHRRFKVPSCYSEEDHYQDVAIRFWKTLPSFRGQARLGTLVYRIARNQLVDMRRRRWQREDPEATLRRDDDLFDRLEHLSRVENVNAAEEAAYKKIYRKELLSTLGKKEYSLYQARYVYGHTEEEIAQEEGVTRQAISKRLTRLVGKLKKINDEASSQDSELSDFSDVVTR